MFGILKNRDQTIVMNLFFKGCSLPAYSFLIIIVFFFMLYNCQVQPRLIQGIRSGDGVGEDQDTIVSIRY